MPRCEIPDARPARVLIAKLTRIVEHPFHVIVLDDGRLGRE
jgi:hypothetical protein